MPTLQRARSLIVFYVDRGPVSKDVVIQIVAAVARP